MSDIKDKTSEPFDVFSLNNDLTVFIVEQGVPGYGAVIGEDKVEIFDYIPERQTSVDAAPNMHVIYNTCTGLYEAMNLYYSGERTLEECVHEVFPQCIPDGDLLRTLVDMAGNLLSVLKVISKLIERGYDERIHETDNDAAEFNTLCNKFWDATYSANTDGVLLPHMPNVDFVFKDYRFYIDGEEFDDAREDHQDAFVDLAICLYIRCPKLTADGSKTELYSRLVKRSDKSLKEHQLNLLSNRKDIYGCLLGDTYDMSKIYDIRKDSWGVWGNTGYLLTNRLVDEFDVVRLAHFEFPFETQKQPTLTHNFFSKESTVTFNIANIFHTVVLGEYAERTCFTRPKFTTNRPENDQPLPESAMATMDYITHNGRSIYENIFSDKNLDKLPKKWKLVGGLPTLLYRLPYCGNFNSWWYVSGRPKDYIAPDSVYYNEVYLDNDIKPYTFNIGYDVHRMAVLNSLHMRAGDLDFHKAFPVDLCNNILDYKEEDFWKTVVGDILASVDFYMMQSDAEKESIKLWLVEIKTAMYSSRSKMTRRVFNTLEQELMYFMQATPAYRVNRWAISANYLGSADSSKWVIENDTLVDSKTKDVVNFDITDTEHRDNVNDMLRYYTNRVNTFYNPDRVDPKERLGSCWWWLTRLAVIPIGIKDMDLKTALRVYVWYSKLYHQYTSENYITAALGETKRWIKTLNAIGAELIAAYKSEKENNKGRFSLNAAILENQMIVIINVFTLPRAENIYSYSEEFIIPLIEMIKEESVVEFYDSLLQIMLENHPDKERPNTALDKLNQDIFIPLAEMAAATIYGEILLNYPRIQDLLETWEPISATRISDVVVALKFNKK